MTAGRRGEAGLACAPPVRAPLGSIGFTRLMIRRCGSYTLFSRESCLDNGVHLKRLPVHRSDSLNGPSTSPLPKLQYWLFNILNAMQFFLEWVAVLPPRLPKGPPAFQTPNHNLAVDWVCITDETPSFQLVCGNERGAGMAKEVDYGVSFMGTGHDKALN